VAGTVGITIVVVVVLTLAFVVFAAARSPVPVAPGMESHDLLSCARLAKSRRIGTVNVRLRRRRWAVGSI
jgi:hypothetical protein